MRQLFIPPLGKELTLAADWTFPLLLEDRNMGLIHALKVQYRRDPENGYYLHWNKETKPVTLPAGTVLTVRRIYIRLGQSDFDSVTFSAKVAHKSVSGKVTLKSHRFWAKLADANNIIFTEGEANG